MMSVTDGLFAATCMLHQATWSACGLHHITEGLLLPAGAPYAPSWQHSRCFEHRSCTCIPPAALSHTPCTKHTKPHLQEEPQQQHPGLLQQHAAPQRARTQQHNRHAHTTSALSSCCRCRPRCTRTTPCAATAGPRASAKRCRLCWRRCAECCRSVEGCRRAVCAEHLPEQVLPGREAGPDCQGLGHIQQSQGAVLCHH